MVDTGVIAFHIRAKHKRVAFKMCVDLPDGLFSPSVTLNMRTLIRNIRFQVTAQNQCHSFKTYVFSCFIEMGMVLNLRGFQ